MTSTNKLYSLKDEDDVITRDWMIQVNKLDEKEKYSIAIHTGLSYVLVHVCKASSKVYDASVVELITSDLKDYEMICTSLIPSTFIEFIAYQVTVTESPNCNRIISRFATQSQRTR